MTLEEILDRYEDLWRQADRDRRPHWRGGRKNSRTGICAVLSAHASEDRELALAAHRVLDGWACTVGRCDYFSDEHGLWAALIHLNDLHRWTFAQLAKDFRTAYREGLARWRNGIAVAV